MFLTPPRKLRGIIMLFHSLKFQKDVFSHLWKTCRPQKKTKKKKHHYNHDKEREDLN